MVIDASFLDRDDIAEMWVEARSALVSISPASSTYSREVIVTSSGQNRATRQTQEVRRYAWSCGSGG